MLIRSQDGKLLTENLNMHISRNTADVRYAIVTDKLETLGIYTNEDKASKVLDKICAQYHACQMCRSGVEQLGDYNFVFQMPQDNEV